MNTNTTSLPSMVEESNTNSAMVGETMEEEVAEFPKQKVDNVILMNGITPPKEPKIRNLSCCLDHPSLAINSPSMTFGTTFIPSVSTTSLTLTISLNSFSITPTTHSISPFYIAIS